MNESVVLITGSAKRVGAVVAEHLHSQGFRVIIHYHQSAEAAQTLAHRLNAQRPDSAALVQGDLDRSDDIQQVAQAALGVWQRLDVLINNASSYYATPVGEASDSQWEDLFGNNAKAPFFLTQALTPELHHRQGCVINIVDIYAEHPVPDHPIYCAAKAANRMLVKALAKDLGPDIRVNGIAPGAILWPKGTADDDPHMQQLMETTTALQRRGDPMDIARAASFLIQDAPYITGQIIAVDGGRSLNI